MTMVEMQVNMDCAGCESKIRRVLQKLEGVDDVDIDMDMQKVTVMGSMDKETVLKVVRKSGQRAELWLFPYNAEYHGFVREYNYYDPDLQGEDHHYHQNNFGRNYLHNSYGSDYEEEGEGEQEQEQEQGNGFHYYGNPCTKFMPVSLTSSYNYYKHGYAGSDYGYYQRPPYSAIVGEQASAMFSDDNMHACSIM